MPIILGALLPHPHCLIPEIKDQKGNCPKTSQSFIRLKNKIQTSNVDTFIIISNQPGRVLHPYAGHLENPVNPEAIQLPGVDKVQIALPELAPSKPVLVYNSDTTLAGELKKRLRSFGIKVELVSDLVANQANSICVYALALPQQIKILMMTIPYRSAKSTYDLGKMLASSLKDLPQNIALCAVGNLSSRLSQKTPEDLNTKASQFDNSIQKAIKNNDCKILLDLKDNDIEASGQEAFLPLLMTMAALEPKPAKLESYETQSGTGYAVISWL